VSPPADALRFVTIYDHPSDHPTKWVVRLSYVVTGVLEPMAAPVAYLFDSLDKAREYVHQEWPGLTLVQSPGDDPDPVIWEVYV
jgi:hypothetical protein